MKYIPGARFIKSFNLNNSSYLNMILLLVYVWISCVDELQIEDYDNLKHIDLKKVKLFLLDFLNIHNIQQLILI
jgi:hypothetical protein